MQRLTDFLVGATLGDQSKDDELPSAECGMGRRAIGVEAEPGATATGQ
jgi:hypothetical protein